MIVNNLIYKTQTIYNNSNPIYNEIYKYELSDGEIKQLIKEETQSIRFEIYEEIAAETNPKVGEFSIKISSLKDQKEHHFMHGYVTKNGQIIDESVQMEVHVALTWNYYSKNEDKIIAFNNSIQRSIENRKKLRTKIELM
mmetsp:Transcript_19998/g.16506  ORF Transcript_19998/g.16506 Transcript_19998/m.16506 type:complete len:140 (+) Transcript_19998:437-856(+)